MKWPVHIAGVEENFVPQSAQLSLRKKDKERMSQEEQIPCKPFVALTPSHTHDKFRRPLSMRPEPHPNELRHSRHRSHPSRS